MKENLNKNFCLAPFNSISISPRGIIRPCCWQHTPKMYKQPNVKDSSNEIEWPTEYVKNLRQIMLSQEDIPSKTPECSSCWHGEKNINWSHRKSFNQYWFQQITNEDLQGLIEYPKITNVDMQFGYLCNNSCLMCTPSQSSHLYTTHTKLIDITTDQKQKDFYNTKFNFLENHKKDWTDDPVIFEKIKNLCEDVIELRISGGEPLLNPKLKVFLEFLVSKKTPLKKLMITTNGTIYDQEIVDLLNQIPAITFKISLESMQEKEEFIRWPTNWEEKNNNIHQFLTKIKSQNTLFLFSSVIQSLNIFDLADVKRYVISLDRTKNIKYQLQVTNDQSTASLWNVSDSYLNYYLNEFPDDKKMPQVTQHIQNIQGYQNKKIQQQVRFYHDMSVIQKKNFESIFPIYYQFHESFFKELD